MVPFIADVHADVVQQCAELEPLALVLSESVRRPRLVEDAQRESRNLLRVFRPVTAALRQLDDAPASDVGIPIRLTDLRAIAMDEIEHQPFA